MMALTINKDPIDLVLRKEELFWIQEPLRLKNAMRDCAESIGSQPKTTSASMTTANPIAMPMTAWPKLQKLAVMSNPSQAGCIEFVWP